MKVEIEQIAHHRNGTGNSFYVVLFRSETPRRRPMLAVVFGEEGSVAVFDRGLLLAHDPMQAIGFSFNSWRGDHFEAQLREAIGLVEQAPHDPVAMMRGLCYDHEVSQKGVSPA